MNYEGAASLLLAVAVLVARIGVALSMFPMFGGGALPASVRATVVAGLSLCLLPVLGTEGLHTLGRLDGIGLALLLAKEVALGLVLGLGGSMVFWAVHAAGVVIENQAGLSMAATIDPLAGEEDSMLGGLMVQVLSVLFLAAGGLLSLLGVLYESFRVWPITTLGPALEPALWLAAAQQMVRTLGELALRVAAPFVLLMLMVEFGLGLLGRYAPQLQVFFLALPVKVALLVLLLMLYLGLMADGAAALLLPDVVGAMRRLFVHGG